MSGGRMSGGRLSGGLKSYDRARVESAVGVARLLDMAVGVACLLDVCMLVFCLAVTASQPPHRPWIPLAHSDGRKPIGEC